MISPKQPNLAKIIGGKKGYGWLQWKNSNEQIMERYLWINIRQEAINEYPKHYDTWLVLNYKLATHLDKYSLIGNKLYLKKNSKKIRKEKSCICIAHLHIIPTHQLGKYMNAFDDDGKSYCV